jgi:acyl-CoA synthetase (NDP forming)
MLLDSDEVDMLLVALVATGVTDARVAVEMLGEARRDHPAKPMVLVPMGGLEVGPGSLPGITTFRTNEAAIGALARVQRYVEWLSVPHGAPEPTDQQQAASARAVAAELLGAAPDGDRWLDPAEARALLDGYGLSLNGLVANGAVRAAQVAEEIGFPVVLKVADPGVVHKTDRGLVRVGLRSTAEVMSAVRAFGEELGREDADVLVQPVITGPEIALGLVQDPGFGPLVMVAAGGVATELWDDRVFLMPPLTRADAARALRGLRIWPLLNGYRGAPAVDVTELEDVIVSLGRLASDVPQVAELDLNPVVVTPAGCFLVDVKVRLAAAAAVSTGVPRQLRQGYPDRI